MPEKIKQLTPPKGLARLAFRIPIWLYHIGLGGLFGSRFLLLTHTGRKTGQKRQVILEVVRHDKNTNTFIVAAGFGPQSDWYRNIQANPHVQVQSGSQRWAMVARFLTPEQGGQALLDYAKRYPAAMRELARFMGYRLNGSQEDIRAMGETLALAAFEPEQGKKTG